VEPIKIAIVGAGKIAADQHVPAIRQNPAFDLIATVDPTAGFPGIPNYPTLESLAASGLRPTAVSICTPPAIRSALAQQAIARKLHVLLEKPPAATVAEAQALLHRAANGGPTIFAAWHSRVAPALSTAQRWLKGKAVHAVYILWHENIRVWHPGQEWILDAAGFGVFDPGINALSIITQLLDAPIQIEQAVLEIPENRAAPIAARIEGRCRGAAIDIDLNFIAAGDPCWMIELCTDEGCLHVLDGGSAIAIPGQPVIRMEGFEYSLIYDRFANLISAGRSDVDLTPLVIVEEAMRIGRTVRVSPFYF
jgi:predicted dehydrogenase